MSNRTIAAISSPMGEGGIGLIRISGEAAFEVADRVFKAISEKSLAQVPGYTALLGHVFKNNEIIDEAIALVFKKPHSYTGEDTVELSVHGGEYVTKALLREVLEKGAVLAEPGEFTKKAFLNGKIDLAQAESVAAIISAEGEKILKASIAAKEGMVSKEINKIKKSLLEAATSIAVFSDYPDETPEFSGIDKLETRLEQVEKELNFLIDNYDAGKILRTGISVAIIGRPNVGKSTLMNLLSGYDKAIVTSIAGTTRDVIEETIKIGEIKIKLSDTAGIRPSQDEVEKIGIERSEKSIQGAEFVLAVFDSAEKLTKDDYAVLDKIKDKKTIAIFNKSDLPCKAETEAIEIKGIPSVFISAKSGQGREKLLEKITELLTTNKFSGDGAVLSSERQRDCVLRAKKEVAEALNILKAGITLDAVGICIDAGLAALFELTGEKTTVEVTNEIFKNFCVGK